MPYKTGILIGQITKTSGFDGSVIVRLRNKLPEDMPQPESVFLEIEGRPVPFIVVENHYEGGELLRLKFDGYDSAGKLSEYRGCNVFLAAGTNDPDAGQDNAVFNRYTVKDTGGDVLGKIEVVIENPGQFLLSVRTGDGRELLIPFHEDLIISIDQKRKIITMEIPEGLRDIN